MKEKINFIFTKKKICKETLPQKFLILYQGLAALCNLRANFPRKKLLTGCIISKKNLREAHILKKIIVISKKILVNIKSMIK